MTALRAHLPRSLALWCFVAFVYAMANKYDTIRYDTIRAIFLEVWESENFKQLK